MPYKDREKYLERQRSYYRSDKDRYKARAIKRQNLVRYGITPEIFDVLCQSQNGLCPICGRLLYGDGPKMKKPHIDHDHKTGKVRGILCGRCNVGLGSFDDDAERLIAAASYLLRQKD